MGYDDETRDRVREYDAILHQAITRIIKNVGRGSGVRLSTDELFFIWEQFLAVEADEVAENTRYAVLTARSKGGE